MRSLTIGIVALMMTEAGLVASPPADPSEAAASREERVISLFNGRDLSGLTTWLKDAGRDDPRQVFRVRDGLLHISGDGFGYVGTVEEHRDYRLVVEYRWGKRTDGGKFVRNSGILLNATGPAGGANGTWMASIECQLAQGCVGDLIVIPRGKAAGDPTPVRLTSEVVLGPDKRPRWKEGGTPRVFTGGQLWWANHDPNFKELIDTRGKDDPESPPGEWTRVECVCERDRIEVRVNGVTVNKCFGVSPAAGKVLLQTEGFELFVRKFELHPLKK